MKAHDIMRKEVTAALPTTALQDIARQLLQGGFSGMPVVDQQMRLRGIISQTDLLRAFRDGLDLRVVPAGDIMSPAPITVDPEMSVEDVADILVGNDVARVPVVREGKLVGIITRTDVLTASLGPEFVTLVGH